MSYDYRPFLLDLVCRDELAEQLRIPLVRDTALTFRYISAVVLPDPDAARPSVAELRAVASWHDHYLTTWFGPAGDPRRATLERFPYDIAPHLASRYLIKTPGRGWAFRRPTWRCEDTFTAGGALLPALDRAHRYGLRRHPSPTWTAWKQHHHEIFAPLEAA
ncbi:hypothetical protein [Nocardia sp. NPDC051570]|uniref:hypothetical protein n=1 Tax=Nocardia sp. NPDC051570 TaxID=3364324 RepID=UPI0037BBD720